jgi:hypothetical protein
MEIVDDDPILITLKKLKKQQEQTNLEKEKINDKK